MTNASHIVAENIRQRIRLDNAITKLRVLVNTTDGGARSMLDAAVMATVELGLNVDVPELLPKLAATHYTREATMYAFYRTLVQMKEKRL